MDDPERLKERKVVTVLFADLVGFTARASTLDPEDVEAILKPYHGRLRYELERKGGTVEKFIGDAVVALFGAPVAHEDDPERAVRAALAIRDWIEELGDELQVRIAVNTGEALVTLGARPAEGEGMAAGDVVNTAARLQAAAPVNAVLVGEQTYRATRDVIEFLDAPPVAAKGKSERVPVWQAVQPRARFGSGVVAAAETELVGRERELALLRETCQRVREERSPQLVTLVGEPGIGKSRLTVELFAELDRGPELSYWRQGRSLPYGEGVTFWALAEMVKAQAGILETDGPEQAAEKVRHAVDALLGDDPQARWVEAHLRPLVGLAAEAELSGDRRGESFAAWRRFFEAMAEQRPLVLVFDDLHWADDDLLDFVDHMVEWASGVPVLVVATARPELYDRRPGWGGGKRNAVTISLSPLSDVETSRLLAARLGQPLLDAKLQSALLARAGGNPLYAEQYARMLRERGEDEELPLPESVQGIIAARLDLLPASEKQVLQDAAVLGKVFWSGALAAVGGVDRSRAEELLHALERKEFVQPVRRSSVADEREFAFRHLLVRDVAYGQIPRAPRAEKHRLAAEWIESLGRPEDHAEMLAHHYLSALELARAAGADASGIAESARHALVDAGDRAAALSAFGAAMRFYRTALDLSADDDDARPQLLFRHAKARYRAEGGDEDTLVEARDALLQAGDPGTAAEVELLLADLFFRAGDRARSREHLDAATVLVDPLPASRAKAWVLGHLSRYHMLAETDETVRIGEQALAMAEELGLDELRAHALNNIGVARFRAGDPAGYDHLEQSVSIALALNSHEAVRAHTNLSYMFANAGQLRRSWELADAAVRLATELGDAVSLRWLVSFGLMRDYECGDWDAALAKADAFVRECETAPHYHEPNARNYRAVIASARGDATAALADTERAVALARRAEDPQSLDPSLAFRVRILSDAGRTDEARAAAQELLERIGGGRLSNSFVQGELGFVISGLGLAQVLLAALEQSPTPSLWHDATRHVLAGDFSGAAEIFAGIGSQPSEALARLRAAEQFAREGRRADADAQLRRALAFFRSVGATRYVREGEALLAATA